MHSWHKLKSLFIVTKINFDNYILINILIIVGCHRVSDIMSWGNWALVVTTRGQYGYLRKAIVLLFPVRGLQGPCSLRTSLYVVTIGGVNSSPGHLTQSERDLQSNNATVESGDFTRFWKPKQKSLGWCLPCVQQKINNRFSICRCPCRSPALDLMSILMK